MRDIPRSGQLYRHFKGNIYRVITVAKHSETGERLVIYKRDDPDETAYARPLEMFLGEVDKRKYPDAAEKYRFTLCSEEELADAKGVQDPGEGAMAAMDPYLEAFLDAYTISEKVERFYDMKKVADDAILAYVAASLDIEVTGTVEEKYSEILRALKAKQKYEINRLRR